MDAELDSASCVNSQIDVLQVQVLFHPKEDELLGIAGEWRSPKQLGRKQQQEDCNIMD